MGLFSNRVERGDIVAGDHIYSWRTLNIYAHHGIYIGNGLVIHFTAPPGNFNSSSSAPGRGQQRTCPNHPRCEGQKPGGGVAISCLDCFIGNGSLYRYEYGVSRFQFLWFRRGGTCTDDQSDPASTVIRRANYLFENGFLNYNLTRNNCEDFALYCKTEILKIDDKGVLVGRSAQQVGYPPWAGNIAKKNVKVPVEEMDEFHRHQIAA